MHGDINLSGVDADLLGPALGAVHAYSVALLGSSHAASAADATARTAAAEALISLSRDELHAVLSRSVRRAVAARVDADAEGPPISSACASVPTALAARANNELSQADSDRLDSHLENCSRCARVAGRFEAAESLLANLLPAMPPPAALPEPEPARMPEELQAPRQPEPEPARQPEREPEPPQPEPQPEPEPEAKAQPEPRPEPQPEPQAAAQPQPQPEPEPEREPERPASNPWESSDSPAAAEETKTAEVPATAWVPDQDPVAYKAPQRKRKGRGKWFGLAALGLLAAGGGAFAAERLLG
jgi:hypothetical protein